jgi:hypothetical protein
MKSGNGDVVHPVHLRIQKARRRDTGSVASRYVMRAKCRSRNHLHCGRALRIGRRQSRFRHVQAPEPSQAWEDHVRREVQVWAKEHPWLCDLLPSIGDALAVVGGTVFVLDLFTGSSAPTSSPAASASSARRTAGGTVAGVFLQWVNRWQLGKVMEAADKEWRIQRTAELKSHLVENFYRPMSDPWFHLQDMLQKAPVKECEKACAEDWARSAAGSVASRRFRGCFTTSPLSPAAGERGRGEGVLKQPPNACQVQIA